MRLTVLGGTGGTGRFVVDQGLREGHEVVALVRDPAKLPARERLHAVVGDVRDAKAVAQAVEGSDAVVSTLGQRALRTTVCGDAMETLLPAMSAAGVRRLVALSDFGVGDSRGRDFFSVTIWLMLRSIMKDKTVMEDRIHGTRDIDWTIVRPAVLRDRSATGDYRAGVDLRLSWASGIARADVADFMLGQLTSEEYVRKAVAIGPVGRRRG
ncbi:NAD(P)-dependent oxidoreductase [Yinghuangia seranimata]|uniref:NAD(P)-dependent oxidoreductase n=1 Tax=Yinghuangia seranimata TaxID=408067 RepID=UPI00248D1875|nr:NAD(P)H-binding protein [Yinghuangia seranimata]MDI2126297.1 NAD(P)H-binding protein [Yinghuangia seranimata]